MIEIDKHTKALKIVALILIFSVIILLIPFPIAVSETPVEHGVDSVVDMLDGLDSHDTFTPGAAQGQSTGQKIINAFGGQQAQYILQSR